MSVSENIQQLPQQQNSSNSFYHQQIVSGANINVLTIKSSSCGNTSSVSPAIYIERGSSVENLPPQENNSIRQSINASRSNIGCGKAISYSRSVSQGAYIIPSQSVVYPDNRVPSRAPLATLQPSIRRTSTMSQTKQILQANYASMQSENLSDVCLMEQDEQSQPQNSQVFQLFSSLPKQQPQPVKKSLSSTQVTSTEVKPPAAKRLKLRDSWSR